MGHGYDAIAQIVDAMERAKTTPSWSIREPRCTNDDHRLAMTPEVQAAIGEIMSVPFGGIEDERYADAAKLLVVEVRQCHERLADAAGDIDRLAAELRAQKGGPCETCKHQWRGIYTSLCGRVSIPGHSVAIVACSSLGNGCWAWERRGEP